MDSENRGLTRRNFLKGALGAAALVELSKAPAAFSAEKTNDTRDDSFTDKKIDVHAHFHPVEFFNELEKRVGRSEKHLGWKMLPMKKDTFMQTFSIEERLEWMSKFGIDKSVFSFPTMNIYMDEIAEQKKRNDASKFINDFFANTHQKHPDRAMFLADVPLGTDPEFSIKELTRAIAELHLQGVAIQTNNAGRLPHERVFDDFFSEAERLDVPVFIHPGYAPWFDKAYSKFQAYMFEPVVGFPADATIAIAYMIVDGFFERHKKSKIILTHLGSAAPYIYERINVLLRNPYMPPKVTGKSNLTKHPREYLKMFYYDTAIGNPEALRFCTSLVGEDRILFGTDHPYIESAERFTIDYINETKLTSREREKLYFKNASALFKINA